MGVGTIDYYPSVHEQRARMRRHLRSRMYACFGVITVSTAFDVLAGWWIRDAFECDSQTRLGHASPAAALRYQHATQARDRVIADRMNALLERTVSPSCHDDEQPPALRSIPSA